MKAVLLSGSPGMDKSASETMGRFLLAILADRGYETALLHINQEVAAENLDEIVQQSADADLMILAYPVYMDALPALTVLALRAIARQRRAAASATACRFSALAVCGLPEALHTAVSLRICQRFAQEAGMTWLGGLGTGMGGLLEGAHIGQGNRLAQPLLEALEEAGAALADGQTIPQAAVEKMAKPLVPIAAFRAAMNYNFEQHGKEYRQQPYRKDNEPI